MDLPGRSADVLESPGEPGFSETHWPGYRRIPWAQLALLWAGFVAFMLLLWALIASSPVNWTQGAVTALAAATALTVVLAWRMHGRADLAEPVRRSASWTRGGTPHDALSAVEGYAVSHLGRTKKNGSQLTLYFGSRLAFRLIGVSTDRIPYAVRVSVAASQGASTELTAEARSDAGPYIWRTQFATHLYEQLLAQTLSELEQL